MKYPPLFCFFNSHPHKEDDWFCKLFILCCAFSTHILTRRMTLFPTNPKAHLQFFNSHPHKEDDNTWSAVGKSGRLFNSHPHKEDDAVLLILLNDCEFSTHILTRRMTHCYATADLEENFSTHILTRRMTAILNKNTLSKTARIIPFEYNTLKIYIFSNSYLLFFWKSTPFSSANLPEDFCALIIRTKISKYP